MITDYMIIAKSYEEYNELERAVRGKIKEGWRPFGDLKVANSMSTGTALIREMVKESK